MTSMTKVGARYTEIMPKMLKFTVILDRLEINATFVITSSLSLLKATLHIYKEDIFGITIKYSIIKIKDY